MVDSRAMSKSLRLSENGVTRPGRWLFARPLVLLALALILTTVVLELSCWSRIPSSTLLRDEVAAPEHYGAIELSRPLVAEFLSDHPLPGLSLCVGIEGAPAWCIASGYSDLKSRAKLTPDSAVRIGSVSKTLTAAIPGTLARAAAAMVATDRRANRSLPAWKRGTSPTPTSRFRVPAWAR